MPAARAALAGDDANLYAPAAEALVRMAEDGDAKALAAIAGYLAADKLPPDPRKVLDVLVKGLCRIGKPADDTLTDKVAAGLGVALGKPGFHSNYALRTLIQLGPAARAALPVLKDPKVADTLRRVGENRALIPRAIEALGG